MLVEFSCPWGRQELDEAARRRLPKQLYIPLPCAGARRTMLDRELGALPARISLTPFFSLSPAHLLLGSPHMQ